MSTDVRDVATAELSGQPVPVLAQLLALFRRQLLLIAGLTTLTTTLAVVYALVATPVYRAEVILLPVQAESGGGGTLSRLVGQFGGLAGLADLGLGGLGGTRDESLGVLRSRKLLEDFIRERDLLPVLFPDAWDIDGKRWKVSADEIPSVWQGIELLHERVRDIEEDRRSGRVLLAIEWRDRTQAAAWANELVARANETLRQRSIAAAEKSIEYLQSQLQSTVDLEQRRSIYAALQGQMNTMMLARARPDFALRVVDPALTPDKRAAVKPQRKLLVIAGFLAGLFMSAVIVLAWSAVRALITATRQASERSAR